MSLAPTFFFPASLFTPFLCMPSGPNPKEKEGDEIGWGKGDTKEAQISCSVLFFPCRVGARRLDQKVLDGPCRGPHRPHVAPNKPNVR